MGFSEDRTRRHMGESDVAIDEMGGKNLDTDKAESANIGEEVDTDAECEPYG